MVVCIEQKISGPAFSKVEHMLQVNISLKRIKRKKGNVNNDTTCKCIFTKQHLSLIVDSISSADLSPLPDYYGSLRQRIGSALQEVKTNHRA